MGRAFGKKTISLAEIDDARPIQTKWYWGYGIKFFGPNRWLYNVLQSRPLVRGQRLKACSMPVASSVPMRTHPPLLSLISTASNPEGIVKTTVQAMANIEKSSQQISQIIGVIEQATGIEQINQAIGQMYKNTQQNASMAEETNAAGQTLATDTCHLSDVVLQFKFFALLPSVRKLSPTRRRVRFGLYAKQPSPLNPEIEPNCQAQG